MESKRPVTELLELIQHQAEYSFMLAQWLKLYGWEFMKSNASTVVMEHIQSRTVNRNNKCFCQDIIEGFEDQINVAIDLQRPLFVTFEKPRVFLDTVRENIVGCVTSAKYDAKKDCLSCGLFIERKAVEGLVKHGLHLTEHTITLWYGDVTTVTQEGSVKDNRYGALLITEATALGVAIYRDPLKGQLTHKE